MDKPHRKLNVWKKSISLVKEVYAITCSFPKSEEYGHKNQIRRCSVSIAANIAEGSARKTTKDKIHFYIISRGSISELDTLITISLELGFINNLQSDSVNKSVIEIDKMLSGLIKSLENKYKISRFFHLTFN
ncbi:MAG: four helix bundle protein [Melioribacteraceae bacterium]|nr:four helix bundle protein [Melioribacteraceae bacterium]MCF8264835.1 four helix bundle protein [Melioribacteraceae bacterium]MCF8431752.1 four helix bundle protein [Melioribacteraceae bacterium]